MSILFAATYPERVTSLILGSRRRPLVPRPRLPLRAQGQTRCSKPSRISPRTAGGRVTRIEWYLPSQSNSATRTPVVRAIRAHGGKPQRIPAHGPDDPRASTSAPLLPAIHVPTLVIQRLNDRITPPFHGRYLAAHIAGARYFEQPGDHSLRFAAAATATRCVTRSWPFSPRASHTPRSRPRAGHDPARRRRSATRRRAAGAAPARPHRPARTRTTRQRGSKS